MQENPTHTTDIIYTHIGISILVCTTQSISQSQKSKVKGACIIIYRHKQRNLKNPLTMSQWVKCNIMHIHWSTQARTHGGLTSTMYSLGMTSVISHTEIWPQQPEMTSTNITRGNGLSRRNITSAISWPVETNLNWNFGPNYQRHFFISFPQFNAIKHINKDKWMRYEITWCHTI